MEIYDLPSSPPFSLLFFTHRIQKLAALADKGMKRGGLLSFLFLQSKGQKRSPFGGGAVVLRGFVRGRGLWERAGQKRRRAERGKRSSSSSHSHYLRGTTS